MVSCLLLFSALGGCSDDDAEGDGASDRSAASGSGESDGGTEATADGTEGAGGTATTEPSAARTDGCPGTAPAIGGDANTGEIIDVDGDGRRDTAWLAATRDGRRELGVVTAAGGSDAVEINSASPVELALLAAEADGRPPVELFVSDNRTVQLWTFDQCSLQPVTSPDGQPYQFDLGFRGTGTGVGCTDADGDGRQDLVGLNVTRSNESTVDWSRTIIERDGLEASNGETDTGIFQRADAAAQIDLLYTVTCGDLTMNEDAIRQPLQ